MSDPGEVWASFDHDPRQPGNAQLRASDRDRDVIRSVLAAAYADGRLDREEFDERSEAVSATRRLGELPPVIADLVPERSVVRSSSSSLVGASPADLRRLAESTWASERRNAVLGMIGSTLVCWAIWVATSWGDGFDPYFPWPLIVMAVSAANLIRVVVTKEDAVRDEIRRLEKRQAKQMRWRRPRE